VKKKQEGAVFDKEKMHEKEEKRKQTYFFKLFY
jgi:hypothetical protein